MNVERPTVSEEPIFGRDSDQRWPFWRHCLGWRAPRRAVLLVVSIVFCFVVLAVFGMAMGPGHGGRSRLYCARHLSGLGQLFINMRLEQRGVIPHNGPALFLWFRQEREIREGEEEYLLCPGDPEADWPESDRERKTYGLYPLDRPSVWKNRVSYAVRDFERFPLSDDPGAREVLASCRCGSDGRTPHHRGGLTVLYSTGSAKFLTWETLGFGTESPPEGTVLVGPGSPSPELAKLILPP